MMKTLFRLVIVAFAALILVGEAAYAKAPAIALNGEQQAAIGRINAYLNSFQTLKGDFSQVGSKGNVATGVLYISKPGKLRFDYSGNPTLIIADGRWLTMMDRNRMRGDQFPLSATPLRLVVSPQVDLLSETDVIAMDTHDGLTSVSLQDRKDSLGGGYITLIFDEKLKQLSQWTVVDGKNHHTTVQLSHLEYGDKFDPKLFVTGDLNK
jgi:outer membrane lipoprotein-sorting protein